MRWVGYVTQKGDMRNAHNLLVGRPERKGILFRV
jgi:hypothetical protein